MSLDTQKLKKIIKTNRRTNLKAIQEHRILSYKKSSQTTIMPHWFETKRNINELI